MIRLFHSAGPSSRTIPGLLPCVESGTVTDRTRALPATERERLDRQVADLTAARDELDELIGIGRVRASGPDYCVPR
jgi:hypothetical protein